MIHLHNTLTNKKEVFEPLNLGEVKMYNCGPTVYNYPHIGNLRSMIFADLLRRLFEYNGYKVTQVVNITDIGHLRGDGDEGEDKMTGALKREGKPLTLESLKELADFYTKAFLENLISLNIQAPTMMPLASEHINEDIELIKKLEEKGFVYTISDGLYFDTSKDADYGRLGTHRLNLCEEVGGNDESRIGLNPEKRNQHDFALWKFSGKFSGKLNPELGFQSPWGVGFPGWHIECSAMAMRYLGESFDVHTGGIDHIPIHHNNEIAQSESATGKLFAKYWLHHAFLNINNEKISKSVGNEIYLNELSDKGFNPLSYRYFLLGAHYRTMMNFNWEALQGAESALKKLVAKLAEIEEVGTIDQTYLKQFTEFVNDDLNTARALALIWEVLDDKDILDGDKKATILDFDRVLGLNLIELSKPSYFKIPEAISTLVNEREVARTNKEWQRADDLRTQIVNGGYEVKDTESGPKLSPASPHVIPFS